MEAVEEKMFLTKFTEIFMSGLDDKMKITFKM